MPDTPQVGAGSTHALQYFLLSALDSRGHGCFQLPSWLQALSPLILRALRKMAADADGDALSLSGTAVAFAPPPCER